MIFGITGSTGVLGRRLTEYMIENGHQVKCLVRTASQSKWFEKLNIPIAYGDICAPESLVDFVKNTDVCIHLAAQVGFAEKSQYRKVNVGGTRNLCQAIIENNPQCHLINCSTISALKVKPFCRINNSDYAISKYDAEKLIDSYIGEHNLKATTIYPGLIYGPHDTNFVPAVINHLKRGNFFLVSGGEKNAPLIYIDDLCELFLLAATNEIAIGKKYISVKGLNIGIHGFINLIAENLNYPPPKHTIPKPLILPVAVLLDNLYKILKLNKSPKISKRVIDLLSINFRQNYDRATSDLGWRHKTSIEKGLKLTLKWCEEQGFCE